MEPLISTHNLCQQNRLTKEVQTLSDDDGEYVATLFGAPLWPFVQGAFGSLGARRQLSCQQRN